MPRTFAPLLCAAITLGGCAQPLQPVFEELVSPLEWPSLPERPRIRYVGQLQSSQDLKAPRRAFQGLTDFLVGADEPGRIHGPRAVLCSPDGIRIFVADPGSRCLHLLDLHRRTYVKINLAGEIPLLSPVALAAGPENSIYVCDSEEVAIHRFSADDGGFLESLRLAPEILRPVGLCYDERTEELFVVDVSGHDIKVIARDGSLLRVLGRRGEAPGQLNYPCGIVDDGELLWVADTGNHRIQGLTRSGEPSVAFGSEGDAPGNLSMPKCVALDSDGHIYVVDSRFENIQIFNREGELLLFFGTEGIGPGEFWLPSGITIDANNRIWVCDTYNSRLQVFTYLKQA